MISKIFAIFISFILGPLIEFPIFLIILILKTGLTNNQILLLFPILIIFQVFVPFLYILAAYKFGKIHDLDLSKREERITPLIVVFISLIASLVMVKSFGSPLLFHLYIFLIIILIINGLITIFWKISLHMTFNVVSALVINYLYGWQFPVFYISIPLIFWSRLYLKKHTVWQLIGGLVINGAITLAFIFFVL